MTLIILAAGMGSRFGGPKQFFPIGLNQEPLFHYSIHNAAKVGVTEVILVTRQELQDLALISLQSLPLPSQVVLQPTPNGKPRGTAEAVLVGLDAAQNDHVLMINADDYYAQESFALAAECLTQGDEIAAIPYLLSQTLSEFGGVSRAVCQIQDGQLLGIEETHDIQSNQTGVAGKQNGHVIPLNHDQPVSMNLFAFHKRVLSELISYVQQRLLESSQEVAIPDFVRDSINKQSFRIGAKITSAEWFGMTFAEDISEVRDRIARLHQSNRVPSPLWPRPDSL
jgi:bifunctional N-acetylglucosamine-1-phosphate-uridyltransferase/glucosamine-1-phosphate-acetyltransferase GlmU-like protein